MGGLVPFFILLLIFLFVTLLLFVALTYSSETRRAKSKSLPETIYEAWEN
jgi:uncharacterized membrane protein